MRRLPMILLFLIVLAACADGPPPVVVEQRVEASFPPGAIANVIKVDARDELPLRVAELVAPDGTTTSADSLEIDPLPEANGGQTAVGDPWRASMLAPNGNPGLPNAQLDPLSHSQDRLLLMVSTADITLPDPVAYRRDWANYRIRLSFDAGNGRLDTREIAAPEPPPS